MQSGSILPLNELRAAADTQQNNVQQGNVVGDVLDEGITTTSEHLVI